MGVRRGSVSVAGRDYIPRVSFLNSDVSLKVSYHIIL